MNRWVGFFNGRRSVKSRYLKRESVQQEEEEEVAVAVLIDAVCLLYTHRLDPSSNAFMVLAQLIVIGGLKGRYNSRIKRRAG